MLPERHGRNELKDYLVPVSLRSARRLILGDTRRTLASELQRITSVDMFNHDSWHAFSHMMWEFLIADKHCVPAAFYARTMFSRCQEDQMRFRFSLTRETTLTACFAISVSRGRPEGILLARSVRGFWCLASDAWQHTWLDRPACDH